MRKHTVFAIVLFCVCAITAIDPAGPAYCQEDCQARYDQLKRDYDAVSADRANILLQVKNLVEFNSRCKTVDEEIKKSAGEKEAALKEAQKAQEQAAMLADKISSLEVSNANIVKERDEAKRALDKMMLDYKVVPETQRENVRLRNDLSNTQRDLKNLQIRVKRLDAQQIDDSAQIEIYRRQVKEFKKRYELAMAKNRSLEKKIEQVPAKFAEIARENKVLIKETALMHYNLGVFYTKNKEYSRAIAEFEKTVELNPDDASAHYNLGYIYAEYLVNRPVALTHFRKFLSLVKSEDKDVDWVKKYILTWQTWEGKKPID